MGKLLNSQHIYRQQFGLLSFRDSQCTCKPFSVMGRGKCLVIYPQLQCCHVNPSRNVSWSQVEHHTAIEYLSVVYSKHLSPVSESDSVLQTNDLSHKYSLSTTHIVVTYTGLLLQIYN